MFERKYSGIKLNFMIGCKEEATDYSQAREKVR